MKTSKYKAILCCLTHIYMFCSLAANIFLFVSVDVAKAFYTIGGSSGYIGFGIATSETINLGVFANLISMLWGVLSFVVLFVTYVLALKQCYKHICVFMAVDAVVVIAWVLFAYVSGNIYGAQAFVCDAIVSILYSTITLYLYRGASKTEKAADGSL